MRSRVAGEPLLGWKASRSAPTKLFLWQILDYLATRGREGDVVLISIMSLSESALGREKVIDKQFSERNLV